MAGVNRNLFVTFAIMSIILASGCVGQKTETGQTGQQPAPVPNGNSPERAASFCTTACEMALTAKTDMSNGPCLQNPIPEASDWVCDVAHNPRQSVDNLPQNQCSAYREGHAHHFVEVDENCKLIRAV